MSTTLDALSDHRVLSADEERELARRVHAGDAEAREELAAANAKLVRYLARQYQSDALDHDDLVSAGHVGLMKAVERFDPERGFRFSTYASWWIRQAITRAISDESSIVRVPEQTRRELRLLYQAQTDLQHDGDPSPSAEDLAERAGLAVERIQDLQLGARVEDTLDRELADDEQATLGDILPDENVDDPEAVVEAAMRDQRLLTAMVKVLSGRERYIVFMRGAGETYAAIAKQIGCSRERVRQLWTEAIDKLRRVDLSACQGSQRDIDQRGILGVAMENTDDAQLRALALAFCEWEAKVEQVVETGQQLEKHFREIAHRRRMEKQDDRS